MSSLHLPTTNTDRTGSAQASQLDEVLLLADRLDARAEALPPYEHLLARDLQTASTGLRALRMLVLLLIATKPKEQH
jgi:hypothetical protein